MLDVIVGFKVIQLKPVNVDVDCCVAVGVQF